MQGARPASATSTTTAPATRRAAARTSASRTRSRAARSPTTATSRTSATATSTARPTWSSRTPIRDGLCDEQDNCPDNADPTFVDDDGDGRGNVCDACTNIEPVDIVNPAILLKRINTPASDDTLKFTGTVTVPTTPTIDPIAKGVRFRFEDPDGEAVLDATIPGGAYNAALRYGWKATSAGWKYRNVGRIVPPIQGINAITLTKDKNVPGRIKFLITGKKGFYPVFPDEIPLKVSMVIDSPYAQTGQCGEALLTSLECRFDTGSTKLQCENPN